MFVVLGIVVMGLLFMAALFSAMKARPPKLPPRDLDDPNMTLEEFDRRIDPPDDSL